jgi:hypothetical protein
MPDIRDLLRSGAGPESTFDEADVRRRVRRRRVRRSALLGAALPVVLLGVYGVVVATQRSDERVVVSDETPEPTSAPTTAPPASAASAGYTSLAIVGGDVWAGRDGFVERGDGTDRVPVPGPVLEVAASDDGLLWVRGDRWVVAVDPATTKVLGTPWTSETDTADLAPLPSQQVAITLPATHEVAIVKTVAIGLEEVWRITVSGEPHDVVRTTGGDVWVASGDVISELDVGAQGVKGTAPWSGPLYAPSRDGGIWTSDGDRLVDLRPDLLSAGASVAEGDRYPVHADVVVETSYGVYVAGPDGLTRWDPDHASPETIERDVPTALDASGGQVVYVVDGDIRTAQASGAGPQATVQPG